MRPTGLVSIMEGATMEGAAYIAIGISAIVIITALLLVGTIYDFCRQFWRDDDSWRG
jgi:hypothetical protein